MNKLVSIGMPTYNGGEQFQRALHSVLSQTYEKIEIIISDNASSDNTEAFCNAIINEHPNRRIRYCRQKTNIGPAANFDFVLRESAGDYFMWLGHDDFIDSRYIEMCMTEFDRADNMAIVAGRSIFPDLKTGSKSKGIYLSDNPYRRIEDYVVDVTDNSIFYGLILKKYLMNLKIKNCLASDWLLIAGLLFQGKGTTLSSTHISRGVSGTSKSILNILKVLNLPKFIALFPFLNIAQNFFRDITTRPSIYSRDGFFRQYFFGFKMFVLVIKYKSNSKSRIVHQLSRVKRYLKGIILNKELIK